MKSLKNSSYAERRAQSRFVGNLSERAFVHACHLQDWIVMQGSRSQDIFDHVDYIVTTKTETFSVDVKTAQDQELIWIEIKNVKGELGWLYGKADRIAFYTSVLMKVIMVDREELKEYVHKNTIKEIKPKGEALHHLYQRAGRRDILTQIPVAALFTFTSLKIIRHEPI